MRWPLQRDSGFHCVSAIVMHKPAPASTSKQRVPSKNAYADFPEDSNGGQECGVRAKASGAPKVLIHDAAHGTAVQSNFCMTASGEVRVLT